MKHKKHVLKQLRIQQSRFGSEGGEELASKKRVEQAYVEINQTEEMLIDDGIDVVKSFLAITPEEQLQRFE